MDLYRTKHRMRVPVTLGVVAALACGGDATAPEGDGVLGEWVQSGNLRRNYKLFVPSSYDGSTPFPLIIAFHGFAGSGPGFEGFTGLDAPAQRHGFVVAYPSGVGGQWATGCDCTDPDEAGIDDVQFVSTLIDHLAEGLAIDRERVYLTGLSQGGFMLLRAACELPRAIAGVASVAASMFRVTGLSCAPRGPIPILYILGTIDELVPWGGTESGSSSLLPVDAAVALWTRLNGCPDAPAEQKDIDEINDGTTVRQTTYTPCDDGAEVELYTVFGGGHTWPNSLQLLPPDLGPMSRDIVASDVIVEFFSRH
jgi:polyhydroxybutyrate depolymerase